MNLKDKRILLTGGAGFVGSHIVDQPIEEGCDTITVIDNMTRGRLENLATAKSKVELIPGDIRDHGMMERLIRHADVVVFHQAALRITHCAAAPRLAIQVMVDATFDILELCARLGVEKVVAASSASAYGMARRLSSTEAARQSLGFETSITLEQGLADLVEWWRHECQLADRREAVG
jgi:nucleoside-diphosphate-sugar epimerase